MNKKYFLAVAIIFTSVISYAQKWSMEDELNYKQVSKINLASFAVKTISIQEEYLLKHRMSVALGLRFSPMHGLPGYAKNLLIDNGINSKDISSIRYGGFAITPEFRVYLGKTLGKGYYIAPFLRYEKQTLKTNLTFSNTSTADSVFDFTGSLGGLGFGIMQGVQFNLSERMVLDWWIAGGYYKYHTLTLKAHNDTGFGLNAQDKQDFINSIAEINSTSGFPVTGSITDTDALIKSKMLGFGYRFGITLGYRF